MELCVDNDTIPISEFAHLATGRMLLLAAQQKLLHQNHHAHQHQHDTEMQQQGSQQQQPLPMEEDQQQQQDPLSQMEPGISAQQPQQQEQQDPRLLLFYDIIERIYAYCQATRPDLAKCHM
eukprot:jgi/Chrzof1/10499/Cz05g01030.t1